MAKLLFILQLIRVPQWIKNLLLFFPAFFAGKANNLTLMHEVFLGFLAFSMAASAIYVFNDVHDREQDRLHPAKKYRPIAAGHILENEGRLYFALLGVSSLFFMAKLNTSAGLVLAGYLALNIAYTLILKKIAILDIAIVAAGFVFRLYAGACLASVHLSMWIVLITYLLALFMALAKRRDDVLLLAEGTSVRKAVSGYNLEFINASMVLMASATLVSYILYTVSPEVRQHLKSDYLYLTVFFVLGCILRYMQITFVEQKSGSPTAIFLGDRFLQMALLGWFCTFGWFLYGA